MATYDEVIRNFMVNLPSCGAKVDPLNIYEDLFAPLCGNNSIEGLVTPLYQCQRTAVASMLHQELYPSVRIRGGILAGKPRTGKILECLALIILTKDQLACPTALNVLFTIPVCNLTYQRYLDHTLLSPYHYPDRHTKSCHNSIEDRPCDTELSCLPNTNIVPPLRYLTFRQILHCSNLTEKAQEVLLPPDLQELLYITGSSYLEEQDFTTTYFDNPERPFLAIVRYHQEYMVLFTDSTPDISKFKSALAAIPSQGLKAWKRLHQGYPSIDPVRSKMYPFLSMIPSRTTLVIVPKNYLITCISEIKKHVAPNALKYLVVRDYSKPSVTVLLKSDLVLISHSELFKAYCCNFNTQPVRYISPPLLHWLLTTYVARNHFEKVIDGTTLLLYTHHTIHLNCGYHEIHVYNLNLALVVTCMILNRIEGPERGRPLYKFGFHWDLKALWCTPSPCESRMWEVKRVYFILKEVLLNPNEAGLSSTEISLLQQCQYWMEQGLRNQPQDYDEYYSNIRYFVDAWALPPPVPLYVARKPGFISIRRLLGNNGASHLCEKRTRCLSGSTPILVAPLDGYELRHLAKNIDEQHDDTGSVLSQAMGSSPPANLGPSSPDGVLAARNHMKALTMRGCSSAQLTYLVNQLRVHTPHEKCVVYVNSVEDFVDVKAFMTTIKFQPVDGASTKGYTFPVCNVYSSNDYGEVAANAEATLEFTTIPNCRRIDLTVATRVYFYSPVWCDSVEMHAIARFTIWAKPVQFTWKH
ncbi:hypothetical protein IWQ61_003515 [Dispira simplex]|nr:hypothetical protein IWQ61_003515 [Dispira simplex]